MCFITNWLQFQHQCSKTTVICELQNQSQFSKINFKLSTQLGLSWPQIQSLSMAVPYCGVSTGLRMALCKTLLTDSGPTPSTNFRKADVFLVFDRYYDYSIKSYTRTSRKIKKAHTGHKLRTTTPLPSQQTILTTTENKVQLIDNSM